ncbi:16S rRNA (cytosine(1402)-N(4))-methyltransferase RsmH [Candidatus Peregrinibacteria bacterium]|nr:16S rRNA (cytosine(1402)-N(4))-methyltransferase RsmH [Candidatus Peregrinibacteria bacterium]MBI2523888.1 16S rRNA (cytosine(1402)-N(4))-methyltransferase RsmH [Candidatus Peregrinibacteria bacterium]MBI4129367.1 16S rRNA (cytosine(1402)-N(4))-methyltransferase RsmH [Candidatus Peregrinibacteria bacterium]
MEPFPPIHHTPVLQEEILRILAPAKGETVLDATVGLGGHARAFLPHIGPNGQLIGIDADEENLAEAARNLARWKGQVRLIHENFRSVRLLGLANVDILFADLGLSSPHIDDPDRGFTFRSTAPLDLRFDRTQGIPASAFLRNVGEKELANILKMYGELPQSHPLAEALYRTQPKTTLELKAIAEQIYRWRAPRFLPQIFQALRIAVNDELNALRDFLHDGPELLAPLGRMGILCYHSLEDRMVKQAFRRPSSLFHLLTPKVIRPTPDECARNPRSRSARFRAIERAAPFPQHP